MANPTYESASICYAAVSIAARPGRSNFYSATRYWQFHNRSGTVYYISSTDNSTWTAGTSIGAATYESSWATWFDGTYVHYCRWVSGHIYYRRGTPVSDGSMTWSAAEQDIVSSDTIDWFMSITVDTGGHAWIGAQRQASGVNSPVVWRNADTDGTWTNDTGFPYALHSASAVDWSPCPMCLSNGDVYVAYYGATADSTGTLGKLWNSTTSTWGSEETVSATTTDSPWGNSVYGKFTTNGKDCAIVFLTNPGAYSYRILKRIGSTWSADTLVNSGLDYLDQPTVTMDAVGNIYVFYTKGSPGLVIYMKYYYAGAWSTEATIWTGDYTFEENMMNSFPIVYNNKIGIVQGDNSGGTTSHTHFIVVSAPSDLINVYINYGDFL
jgi:hypothetical protein